ncbi:hypothetical protein L218DRAFT_1006926 [Marasmius fiardii PR-910]|nr:hypothetical protein L218DRAFT_949671 [Marasmius fiardii PR-910]KAF9256805.1 hypothetical protein L218DRAFT_1006926 [Marasmius fiardii PR-910]
MAPPPPPPRFPGINPSGTERSLAAAWKTWLAANQGAADVPITKIEHMKNFQKSPVDHEFLIITVKLPPGQPSETQQIIAERQISDPPDQLIYGPWSTSPALEKHRAADFLGRLDFEAPYPTLLTIATIFVKLADLNPKYSWHGGNCFWFAGSVWASIEDLASVKVQSQYWPKRGRFAGLRIGYEYNNVGHATKIQQEDVLDGASRETRAAAADPIKELEEEERLNRAVRDAVPVSKL